jgi:hypothetical protein
MAFTFKEMTDNPVCNGLCGKCDLVPCKSDPSCGCITCEGSHCKDSYQSYLEEKFDDPCHHCKNHENDTMGKVAACNCCEQYEFFDPIEEDE